MKNSRKIMVVMLFICVLFTGCTINADVNVTDYRTPAASVISITVDQTEYIAKDARITISGTYQCTNLSSIRYICDPYTDEIGSTDSSLISIAGNRWSTIVNLRPGNNRFNFTISDSNGNTAIASTNVIYEIGNGYILNEKNVSYSKKEGINYVNNMIVIYFKEDATLVQIDEVVRSINGVYVGVNKSTNCYQIRIPVTDLSGLEKTINELETKYSCIEMADYDRVYLPDTNHTEETTDSDDSNGLDKVKDSFIHSLFNFTLFDFKWDIF